jgi:hypothetical protein
MCAEALQLFDMGRPESEGIAFEFFQHARCSFVSCSDALEISILSEKGALEVSR